MNENDIDIGQMMKAAAQEEQAEAPAEAGKDENTRLSASELSQVSLPDFYSYILEIMGDFNYAVHRNVSEVLGSRRIEIWKSKKDEGESALLWVELVPDGTEVDEYIGTDVLRTMNEENVTNLFFFTNGELTDAERKDLDDSNHYIFTISDIIETMSALDNKRVSKQQKKRKNVKAPSGFVLIKNYLKSHANDQKMQPIKMTDIAPFVRKTAKRIRKTLEQLEADIENINEIPNPVKEKYKSVQYSMLPELMKISALRFPPSFSHLKESLFGAVQYTIIYIGAVIEYESETQMANDISKVEEHMEVLEGSVDEVSDYIKKELKRNEMNALKLFILAIVCIIGSLILLYFMGE